MSWLDDLEKSYGLTLEQLNKDGFYSHEQIKNRLKKTGCAVDKILHRNKFEKRFYMQDGKRFCAYRAANKISKAR